MPTPRSKARGRDSRPSRRLASRLKREAQVCWICGHWIDPELRSPHPLSFTVDHIVPLALGGAAADPGNVRAAHRLCNMKRGTGRGRPSTQGDRSSSW